MGLESSTYIDGLVVTNPVGGTDLKSQGDDHIRLLKSTLKNTFPNVTGAVNATQAELNALDGISTDLDEFLGAANYAAARTLLGLGTAALVDTGTADAEVPTNTQLKGTVRTYAAQQVWSRASLGISAGTVTWDLDDYQTAELELTENVTTLTINNPLIGGLYRLQIYQDGIGGRTVAWPASFKWPGGTPMVMSSAANAQDALFLWASPPSFYVTFHQDFS